VGEEEPDATLDLVLEKASFLINQLLGIPVVTHRHGQMHPRSSRNEIRAKVHATRARPLHFRQQQARRVTVARLEAHGVTETRGSRPVDDLEPAALL
jgi:hypothetical protein